MAFTNDQQLETQASGQADWDTSLNANFTILERGWHLKASAGAAISSGQVCLVGSGGWIIPMDAKSMDNKPMLISYKSINSGDNTQFLAQGIVRSMTVWSGNIVPGKPVFVGLNSAGFCVSSYGGCGDPVGVAIGNDAILFRPGMLRTLPELVTHVATLGPTLVGTWADFALPAGRAGTVRDMIITTSHNRFKVQFWTGSTRVASELIYETLTVSYSPLSADITSTYYRDRAMFPHDNTDVNTAWMLYGRISAQSGSGVGSAYFNISLVNERVR